MCSLTLILAQSRVLARTTLTHCLSDKEARLLGEKSFGGHWLT